MYLKYVSSYLSVRNIWHQLSHPRFLVLFTVDLWSASTFSLGRCSITDYSRHPTCIVRHIVFQTPGTGRFIALFCAFHCQCHSLCSSNKTTLVCQLWECTPFNLACDVTNACPIAACTISRKGSRSISLKPCNPHSVARASIISKSMHSKTTGGGGGGVEGGRPREGSPPTLSSSSDGLGAHLFHVNYTCSRLVLR